MTKLLNLTLTQFKVIELLAVADLKLGLSTLKVKRKRLQIRYANNNPDAGFDLDTQERY